MIGFNGTLPELPTSSQDILGVTPLKSDSGGKISNESVIVVELTDLGGL